MIRSARQLSAAFDKSAKNYDLAVSLNPGYHNQLRFAATEVFRRLGTNSPARVIDLGCGSGASTRCLVNAAPSGSTILGIDASAGMLEQAQQKPWPDGVRFDQDVAGQMDLSKRDPGTWDAIHACYLFRNVPANDRSRAVEEAFQLLRPGGWLVVQEYSVAGSWYPKLVWNTVSWTTIIPLGIILDRDPRLHHYLWRSVLDFEPIEQFADRLVKAGFVDIETHAASGWQRGILHTVAARTPEEQ
ncbi:MAG: ubiquinone biosynthesis methyltransferase UbiE [Propionibacteriales bacterium]|nr:MAG: ubiquinone biosynthesis methyltransferase UbiE [Propionibacteriales bacterium]